MKKKLWWFIHVVFRHFILEQRVNYYRHVKGMSIGKGTKISLNAKIDKTNPKGVHIGNDSYIAFDAALLTHDMCRNMHQSVHIGDNCFIGARAIILPGVRLGNSVIVAAGSVVTKSFGSNVIIAGNPAKEVKEVYTGRLGIIKKEEK